LKKKMKCGLENYIAVPVDEEVDEKSYLNAFNDLNNFSAVIVAVPDHLHFEMCKAALLNKKNVFVVKPLTPKVAEARQLTELAESLKLHCAVDFHKRWDFANLKMRQAIEEKKIGDILFFHVEFSQRKIMPVKIFSSWVDQTNIFQYLGVHYADLIYFMTLKKPIRVMATGQKKYLVSRKVETFDAIEALIEWEGGITSTILTHWIDPDCNSAISQQKIKVIGTQGRCESDQTNRGITMVTDKFGTENINPYFCQPYTNYEDMSVEYKGYGIESIRQFFMDVGEVSSGRKSSADLRKIRPSFHEALVSTAVVEGVRLSLENNNNWVRFDDQLNPYF
jgi:D-galacturonate reductase